VNKKTLCVLVHAVAIPGLVARKPRRLLVGIWPEAVMFAHWFGDSAVDYSDGPALYRTLSICLPSL
jgi:hypothetical protein